MQKLQPLHWEQPRLRTLVIRIKEGFWRAFQVWFYYLTLLVSVGVNNTVSRYTMLGPVPPRRGPLLLTMNHLSMWDLSIFYTPTRRPFHFVTKAELFKVPGVNFLILALGSFPLNRGRADRQAMQQAIELLKKGRMVCICPEGHRSPDHKLQKGLNGVALLALKAPPGTKIVPVAVWGTEKIWQERQGRFLSHRPPVYVRYGQPYELELERNAAGQVVHQDLEEITEQIMLKIAELLPPEYQGAYRPEEVERRRQEREQQRQVREASRVLRQATRK